MFSRIGAAALKPSLDNTIRLCEALGNPQTRFRSVHIAGTNGKGSTSHSLAAILQTAGYKTGLYTSPHLVDFRERIRIDGVPVSTAWVVDFVAKHRDLIEQTAPSFFEITVAMAFAAFAESGVEVAVIETGLGGRLDSTNVITPVLSVITNIAYDHVQLLGPTLQDIAREKAGIIKPEIPVLIGQRQTDVSAVFEEAAARAGVPLVYADELWTVSAMERQSSLTYALQATSKASGETLLFQTDLTGEYQVRNIQTVLAAVGLLSSQQWFTPGTVEDMVPALRRVKSLTGLRGRWEVLSEKPFIVADVAHNVAGLEWVLKQWDGLTARARHIVLGFVQDKDVESALALFPKDCTYHFCNAQIPRAMPAAALAETAYSFGLHGTISGSVKEAVAEARAGLAAEDALLVTGSFFVVGEALAVFDAQGI